MRQPASHAISDFGQKEVGWAHQPLSKLKRDTVYTLAQDEGRTVLRGAADRSASAYVAYFKPAAAVPAALSWRWKTDALVPGADNRDKTREDAPLRVIVAFDGDHATLPEVEQKRFKRARNLSGKDLPYAMLMYIWSDQVEVESRDSFRPHQPGEDAGGRVRSERPGKLAIGTAQRRGGLPARLRRRAGSACSASR